MEWLTGALEAIYAQDGIWITLAVVLVIGAFFYLFGPDKVLGWFGKDKDE